MTDRLVQVISDLRFQAHRGPDGHPERPQRLAAVGEILDVFAARITLIPPRTAEVDEILRVHDHHLFEALESTRGQPPGHIDADTYFSPSSYDTACLAAGSCIDLFSRVLVGDASGGLAAVRPPGHHAEADRSMGFCLFNNVAIATRALQSGGGSPRILIYDWDVHHGNGTQHIFESDPDVLYLSTHQFPFYPGTGDFREMGIGRGQHSTINIPMPAGSGDTEFIGLLQRIVVPAAIAFQPDLIVISCGFDAHRDDPLASMELSQNGYRTMSMIMRSLADALCGGRIVFVLEGGYSLDGVREGTEAVLDALITASPQPAAPPSPKIGLDPGSTLKGIVDRVVDVHGRSIKGLGAA